MAKPRLNAQGRINENVPKTRVQRAIRLFWVLGTAAVALYQLATGTGLSQADRFASKLALVALGVAFWHLTRSQIFFYFDLKAWTDTVWVKGSVSDKALVVLAYCILFGLLAVAIILAPALGL